MNRKRDMTFEELEREDDISAIRKARERRLGSVVEKLATAGIDIDDLIELIEDRQSRARY